MRALCYIGTNKLNVESVNDPRILNPKDVILKVALSSVCGSDLHFIHGFVPGMKEGDILGHEFAGEVVETGSAVTQLKKGDRVVVAPNISCGDCFYCSNGDYGLCDNSNPNGYMQEPLMGYPTAAFYGCSHMYGGYAGSHAEYVRVPYAEEGCFKIPPSLSYAQALFVSDALSTGYMAADIAVKPGDVVVVWGAGAVGQMAMASAWLKGASRVIAIDKYSYRLKLAIEKHQVDAYNYEEVDVFEILKESTAGNGPDVCIDAVGMEANTTGIEDLYDKAKQKLHLQMDRPSVLRQAILSCRKGGTLSIIGVYSGLVDKFPIGPLMNKGITVKTGMVNAQKYIPTLLKHIESGKLDPTYLKTHEWALEEGNDGYRFFGDNRNECMRGVFLPNGNMQ